jgi:hypothetical protein
MIKTRIAFIGAVQSRHTGKWACKFAGFVNSDGVEYKNCEVDSAAVWDNEAAANEAGPRAMKIVEETGLFPNMCEIW